MEKDQFENLRKNISIIRHSMMMDKTEFANFFGFRKAFCEVETGRFNPKIDELAKISKHTSLPLDEMMFGELRLKVLRETDQ